MDYLQKLAATRKEFIGLYNEYPILQGWRLELEETKRTLGRCHHARQIIRINRIHIEQSPLDEILDTLRHEIAHALVGSGHGHDEVWKRACIELGARPERLGRVKLDIPSKYEATCRCGRTHKKHRMATGAIYRCKISGDILEWKQNF